MHGQRLTVPKIRDVLRLSADGLSKRKIAASPINRRDGGGRSSSSGQRAGLSWPLPTARSYTSVSSILGNNLGAS
jgi:hypothetical protein